MRWIKGLACVLMVSAAQADDTSPRSAIGWLSESIAERPQRLPEPPTGTGAAVSEVETRALGAPSRDAVGLLPAAVTGLPADAASTSNAARVIALMDAVSPPRLPALSALFETILLAELDPPADTSAPMDAVFNARIDALLRLGALEKAQALMERAGPTEPEIFRRWFDVSLLTGVDDHACNAMTANPEIAPTLPARVFCLSRTGDWAAAALTLDTGTALGLIDPVDAEMLAQFLDPELFEGQAPPPQPQHMTPLRFRLLDGIGETPATSTLPVAFAVADLRPTIGWKARLEAGERLAQADALSPETLRALYTERNPAASGGVWDRARAIQRFDVALLSGEPGAIANALPGAWSRLSEIGLQVTFAQLYGERLARVALGPAAANLALKIGLLSSAYEGIAQTALETDEGAAATLERDRWAAEIALGQPGAPPQGAVLYAAIAEGFETSAMPPQYAHLVAQRRLLEALLRAIQSLASGAQSDANDITDAITLFRLLGLQDTARRTALQLVLLET